jgi:hypothetical protein
MIEGMNEDLIISNSAGTQSHYMLKLLAIESLIRRQRCTRLYGLYKALQAEPQGVQYRALLSGLNRPTNLQFQQFVWQFQ